MKYNFGMPSPEGYRKAQRLIASGGEVQAAHHHFCGYPRRLPRPWRPRRRGRGRPSPPPWPLMSSLTVPVIAVVIGEAGSGGALALAVGNRVILLENAVYSVLSPEGFASILWKDAGRADEAAEVMKLTAADLLRLGVADQVIPEPEGGAQNDPKAVFAAVDKALTRHLNHVSKGRIWPPRDIKNSAPWAWFGRRTRYERTADPWHWTGAAGTRRHQRRSGQDRGHQRRVDCQPHRHQRAALCPGGGESHPVRGGGRPPGHRQGWHPAGGPGAVA